MYEEINRKIQSEYEESYRRTLICLNLASFENKHLRYLQIRNPRRQILWNFRKSCSATVNIGTKARTIRRTHIILSKSWIQKTTPNKSGPNEEINGRHVGFWIINVDAMKSNDHCVSTTTISFLCPLYNSTCISCAVNPFTGIAVVSASREKHVWNTASLYSTSLCIVYSFTHVRSSTFL